MPTPCGCDETSIKEVAASGVAPTLCPAKVHETVCVQADVTIKPHVEVGEIKSFCVDGAIIGSCEGEPAEYCSFSVSQKICVEIPLTFSAIATAEPKGIVCGDPEIGSCK